MSCERSTAWAFARWLALVGAIASAGCTPDICGRSSDCASGLICTTVGACVIPPADASTDDDAATTTTADDAATTPIRDADGDAFIIEPSDAAPAADANAIDAPPDNVATRNHFEGAR